MIVILGIDPGVTTGMVGYLPQKRKVWFKGDYTDPLDIPRNIDRVISSGYEALIVIEDFIGMGPRDKSMVKTMKHLGLAEFYSRHKGLRTEIQPPQVRKAFLDEARRIAGHGHHYIDAMAHILAFIHFHKSLIEKDATASGVNQEVSRL